MSILGCIVFGMIVGAIAKFLMPGRPGGIIVTMVLGIVGSLLGRFIWEATKTYSTDETTGIVMVASGTGIVLIAYQVLTSGLKRNY